jgi:hypothetical protein
VFAQWVDTVRDAVRENGGELRDEGPLRFHVSGPAPWALWRKEAGIQLFLPADGPAEGLLVRIEPDDGPAELPPWHVLRTWIAPTADRPQGLVHDLRTGEMVRANAVRLAFLRWLFAVE